MPTRRDLILRRQEQQNKKADTKPRYRAVLCAADGSRTTGSVWANEDYKLVYFQFFGSGGVGVARCQKIEPQLGLGVYVGKTDDNLEWQVLEDDPLLRRTATDPRGYQSVAARDFEPGGRLQLWLYTKLIVPLATYDTPGTLQVNIVAGDYPYLGTRKTFAGQVGYDLTSHVPGGGLTRYVGLYLDSANTLQAVDGATSAIGSTPAEPTWPAGAFRLSVVQLDNGQTSISFANDIFDRRMAWSDESSSSGWPFDHIVTVSTTNTFADFASIQDAIDSVAAGQVVTVLLDRETFTENLVINSKSVYIFAPILGAPKFGMTTVISGTVTVSTSTGNAVCFIEGCSITGLVSADTGVTANSITVFLSRCSLFSVASRRIAQDGRTALYIDNSYVSYTGGNVISGTITSSPTFIRNSLIEGNISLTSGALSIDAASWPNGYTVTSGTIDVLDYAESGGVWLNDEGSVIKSKFATIPDAITAAASAGGDIIELGPDTYVAPNVADGITVDEPLSIVGLSQVETIITRADNTSTTMAITDTPITLRNLTIRHTGAGAGSSNCLKNNQAGLVLENVYLQKTSGAAGNAIGLSQAAGDSLLVNCKVNVTPGTILNYAVYLHTAGSTCVLEGGEVLAGQLVTAHASAVIELRGVKLASGVTFDVSGGGTVRGWYVDANDNIWHSVGGNSFKPLLHNNYIIVPSVASNNLTVALKNLASNDPSASEPVAVRIGDTIQVITAALSTTKNAGTNWCNSGSSELATNAVDYFVYLIQETGGSAGTKIGFSRIPYGTTVGDFSSTTTNEKYLAGPTNYNASDVVTVIGRFAATLSAGAGYTWSSPGTVINRPIYETRWLSYTPTLTGSGANPTTVGTALGLYQYNGASASWGHNVTVTTAGAASGLVQISLPFTPVANYLIVAGRENAVLGVMLEAILSSNLILYAKYDGTTVWGDTYNYSSGGGVLRLV